MPGPPATLDIVHDGLMARYRPNVADVGAIIDAFGDAAARAKRAGFDAVEIHAAHGFLLSQFLSPLATRRTDAYGGGTAGRRELHLQVLRKVRERLGKGGAISVRLGASDEMAGGLTLDDACATAAALAEAGADLISVSGGLLGSRPAGRGPGYFVPYAAAIKTFVAIPVMVTGGISEPGHADAIVRRGQADLVGIGRAMLTDAEWARKAIAALGTRS